MRMLFVKKKGDFVSGKSEAMQAEYIVGAILFIKNVWHKSGVQFWQSRYFLLICRHNASIQLFFFKKKLCRIQFKSNSTMGSFDTLWGFLAVHILEQLLVVFNISSKIKNIATSVLKRAWSIERQVHSDWSFEKLSKLKHSAKTRAILLSSNVSNTNCF